MKGWPCRLAHDLPGGLLNTPFSLRPHGILDFFVIKTLIFDTQVQVPGWGQSAPWGEKDGTPDRRDVHFWLWNRAAVLRTWVSQWFNEIKPNSDFLKYKIERNLPGFICSNVSWHFGSSVQAGRSQWALPSILVSDVSFAVGLYRGAHTEHPGAHRCVFVWSGTGPRESQRVWRRSDLFV